MYQGLFTIHGHSLFYAIYAVYECMKLFINTYVIDFAVCISNKLSVRYGCSTHFGTRYSVQVDIQNPIDTLDASRCTNAKDRSDKGKLHIYMYICAVIDCGLCTYE